MTVVLRFGGLVLTHNEVGEISSALASEGTDLLIRYSIGLGRGSYPTDLDRRGHEQR